jgi:hypothetical protein
MAKSLTTQMEISELLRKYELKTIYEIYSLSAETLAKFTLEAPDLSFFVF